MLGCKSETGLIVKSSYGVSSNKKVGIFYSIWHGAHIDHSTGTYDNTEILKKLGNLKEKQGITEEEWQEARGGSRYKFHWWGKPLFGYYSTTDEWVLERHVKMLTDSSVDFLVIDFTNGSFPSIDMSNRDVSYVDRLLLLLKILDKYHKQGKLVPQVVCYTYYRWNKTVNDLYMQVYKAHPEYSHLWFKWGNNQKPMIIGNPLGYDSIENELDNEVNEFFDIKDGAFPHETKNPDLIPDIERNDSILWMDFRAIPEKVIADNVSYVAVSTAEINETNRASEQWFRNTKDRTKSWDGKENRNWLAGEENAYIHCYNFERQFNEAIMKDPDVILVTGFNEWIAELQVRLDTGYISFVDVADINNNRDIEPMEDGYGDNYYMLLVHLINKFKKNNLKTFSRKNITFTIEDHFSKWSDKGLTAVYQDYVDDIISRNSFEGFDWSKTLTNDTGINDIDKIKIARDDEFIYLYISTINDIVLGSKNAMTIFLNTGGEDNWCGYDYVINRVASDGDNLIIEQSNGGWSWTHISDIKYKLEGKEMMLFVERKHIGFDKKKISMQFKVADSFESDNIYSFYIDGNCAPYGRLNYIYEEN